MKVDAERLKRNLAKRKEQRKRNKRDINSYIYDALGKNRISNMHNRRTSQNPN